MRSQMTAAEEVTKYFGRGPESDLTLVSQFFTEDGRGWWGPKLKAVPATWHEDGTVDWGVSEFNLRGVISTNWLFDYDLMMESLLCLAARSAELLWGHLNWSHDLEEIEHVRIEILYGEQVNVTVFSNRHDEVWTCEGISLPHGKRIVLETPAPAKNLAIQGQILWMLLALAFGGVAPPPFDIHAAPRTLPEGWQSADDLPSSKELTDWCMLPLWGSFVNLR